MCNPPDSLLLCVDMHSFENIKRMTEEATLDLSSIATQREIMLLWAKRQDLDEGSHREIARQWIESGAAEIYSNYIADAEQPHILHLDDHEEMENFWQIFENQT